MPPIRLHLPVLPGDLGKEAEPDVNHFCQQNTGTVHNICPLASFILGGGLGGYESTVPKRQERERCGELNFQSQYPQQITLAKRLK